MGRQKYPGRALGNMSPTSAGDKYGGKVTWGRSPAGRELTPNTWASLPNSRSGWVVSGEDTVTTAAFKSNTRSRVLLSSRRDGTFQSKEDLWSQGISGPRPTRTVTVHPSQEAGRFWFPAAWRGQLLSVSHHQRIGAPAPRAPGLE